MLSEQRYSIVVEWRHTLRIVIDIEVATHPRREPIVFGIVRASSSLRGRRPRVVMCISTLPLRRCWSAIGESTRPSSYPQLPSRLFALGRLCPHPSGNRREERCNLFDLRSGAKVYEVQNEYGTFKNFPLLCTPKWLLLIFGMFIHKIFLVPLYKNPGATFSKNVMVRPLRMSFHKLNCKLIWTTICFYLRMHN
jgi:hypothetical protein